MRKVIRASVLVLALCGPVFAGDMPTPPAAPPPPQQPTALGEIPNPPAALIDALLILLRIALP